MEELKVIMQKFAVSGWEEENWKKLNKILL